MVVLPAIINSRCRLPELDTSKDLDFDFHKSDNELYVKLRKDYEVEYLGNVHVIPEGFISDGTSYPFNIREAFEKKRVRAAVVHDFFCEKINQGLLTQKQTHMFYRDILKADGVDFFARQKMFWAVRIYNKRNLKWK